VDFRIIHKAQKQQPVKNMKNHGRMVIRRCSPARTQTVDIRLSTSVTLFVISVQNTAVFMAAINLSHSSVALETADVLSTPILLWQSTRNVHTDLFQYLM